MQWLYVLWLASCTSESMAGLFAEAKFVVQYLDGCTAASNNDYVHGRFSLCVNSYKCLDLRQL